MDNLDFHLLEKEVNEMKFEEVVECINDSIRNYLQNVAFRSSSSRSGLIIKSLMYLKNENDKLKNRISELNISENDAELLSAVKTIIKQIKREK